MTTNELDRMSLRWLRPALGKLGTYPARKLELPDLSGIGLDATAAPRISVVIPSYNQAGFIRDTLLSLLDEKYPNLEVIVVDGGSTDASVRIIREFESEIAWWVSEPDGGQACAINKGFRQSTGEVMAWLNSDDRIVPGTLHLVAKFFSKHPDVDIVYGDRILIDADSREIGRWRLPKHSNYVLRWADFVPQETLYWRRRAWERIGSALDDSFQFAMDWDLLLRYARAKLRFRHLSAFMGLFRVHSAQKTSQAMTSVGVREMERLRVRELGYPPTPRRIIMSLVPYLLAAKVVEGIHGLRTFFPTSRPRARV